MNTGRTSRGFPYGIRPEDLRVKPGWVTQFIRSGGDELMKACESVPSYSYTGLRDGLQRVASFIRSNCRRSHESTTGGDSGGDDDD